MDKQFIKILSVTGWVICLVLSGCAKDKPQEPSKIKAIKVENSTAAKTETIRLDVVKQTARGLGAQAALYWQSYYINKQLEKQKRVLDNIFNFNYLLLEHNVLPPILVESRNILNLSDDFSIRVSDREYQIIQQPRFTTTPPHWRDYIWMSYKRPEEPNSALLPRNKDERELWNEYIHIGWNDGLDQAEQIFGVNLAKLQRDYEGMLLYRKLLAQHMVTRPYVSQTELGITGDSENIMINDRILRITAISQLDPNYKQWRPSATTQGKEKSPLLEQAKMQGATLMDRL